jgi:hypothetical protein
LRSFSTQYSSGDPTYAFGNLHRKILPLIPTALNSDLRGQLGAYKITQQTEPQSFSDLKITFLETTAMAWYTLSAKHYSTTLLVSEVQHQTSHWSTFLTFLVFWEG